MVPMLLPVPRTCWAAEREAGVGVRRQTFRGSNLAYNFALLIEVSIEWYHV